MKLLTVVGARPQFIKAATISRAISKMNSQGEVINEIIVHTGQHYDNNMSNVFFNEMQIPEPHYLLNHGGASHGEMTGSMIYDIEQIIIKENPDFLLLYGDTNSTLAGAIAGSKLDVKIAHVEAGLRSFNNSMPEEINRILTDRVSNFLFCPTKKAYENLYKEGISHWQGEPFLVGDIMNDGAKHYSKFAKAVSNIDISSEFVLCTIHRAENTDSPERLKGILSALKDISNTNNVILPLHPRTKKIIDFYGYSLDGLTVIDPVGYLEMIWLILHSKLIMTDSGGLQKEAFFFEKPCITLRDETEWVELVEHGFNKLAGSEYNAILQAFNENIFNTNYSINLYGNGKASEEIVSTLLRGYSNDN